MNKEQLVDVFAKAWNTLDAELIISHLDESFIYDSQWAFASLDFNGYIDYIRAKFKAIKDSCTTLTVKVVVDGHFGGTMIALTQGKNEPVFYRIKVRNGRVVKGDLCMF